MARFRKNIAMPAACIDLESDLDTVLYKSIMLIDNVGKYSHADSIPSFWTYYLDPFLGHGSDDVL